MTSKPIILIDNGKSATGVIAEVIIPSAITGIECEGLAYRLDFVPIELEKIINPPSNVLPDEEILQKLIDKLKLKGESD